MRASFEAASLCTRTRIAGGRILAAAVMVLLGAADIAFAQGAVSGAILTNGDAVVTGFSGAQPPNAIAPGTDPADKTYIDLNGPAARVIDLQAPGAPPQAQLVAAPKPFTATASQIGQVFAVALDNATPPNIYLAATSAYGLPIVAPGAGGGSSDRARKGAPNATFMPGLFGPAALQGGPGSIWRIDGATGEVRLFANVTLDGAPNSGPALGGLAFDPASNALFVADRETGLIRRFDLNGTERGRYDHGAQGRQAAGLPPVAFDPAKQLDIASPQFDTESPESWGYAAPARRIFGLAVHSGRLYYAVAEGLQVWSVAIAADGSFGTDARIEVSVPPGEGAAEISKIVFDDQGMLLAERAAPTGAYDLKAPALPGVGRVLRYRAGQGGAAGWQAAPDEYAIGFAGQLRNGNGGVAIGYGYDSSGKLDPNSCGGFLWSTGEQLRNATNPELAAKLGQGGPAAVNGLQGNGVGLARPANTPPLQSYFVSYDDRLNDPDARGHVGDVAIWRTCARAAEVAPPAPGGGGLGGGGVGGGGPGAGGVGGGGLGAGGPEGGGPLGGGGLGGGGAGAGGQPKHVSAPLPNGACPVGTHTAFLCCQTGWIQNQAGQCVSPCPNGAADATSVWACHHGFAPPANPATWHPWDPGVLCANNTAPVQPAAAMILPPAPVPPVPAWWSQWKCPAPPPPANWCQAGFAEVAVAPPLGINYAVNPANSADAWTNATCLPTPVQTACAANGQVEGPDHVTCVPNPCPANAQRYFTCDPEFRAPTPSPTCFPGYAKLRNGQCCRTDQMTVGGECCPNGQTPDARRRSCVPVTPPERIQILPRHEVIPPARYERRHPWYERPPARYERRHPWHERRRHWYERPRPWYERAHPRHERLYPRHERQPRTFDRLRSNPWLQ